MEATATQHKKVTDYDSVFGEDNYGKRLESAQEVSNNFYDLATEFYEKGWGESFHFAPRYVGESHDASIVRHEPFLATKLGLSPSDKVLDAGCGVMGPARNIARVSGAQITGLTINQHQVGRCKILNSASSVKHLLEVRQGDFMDIPFPDNTFDKVYAIEALCHAPSIVDVYKQIFNKLKPGGKAAFYEWVMTDRYDSANADHVKSKEMIEYGNGICELKTTAQIDKAIIDAGLIMEETTDLVNTNYGNDHPWFATLQSGWSLSQIRHTKAGRNMVHYMLRIMETFGMAPKGITQTHQILLTGADGLVAGGVSGIFTPMYLVVVSKPK
ncbi:MAG: methyltransferase domain-containing protein [Flavobacteriales bacterium]|nr:methyltransferase domain-containing protein [Flavobacteriales bacterium]